MCELKMAGTCHKASKFSSKTMISSWQVSLKLTSHNLSKVGLNFCRKIIKTVKVFKKTVRPIWNITLHPLIRKLAGRQLSYVRKIYISSDWIETWLWNIVRLMIYKAIVTQFYVKISKNEKVIMKIQKMRFFHTPFMSKLGRIRVFFEVESGSTRPGSAAYKHIFMLNVSYLAYRLLVEYVQIDIRPPDSPDPIPCPSKGWFFLCTYFVLPVFWFDIKPSLILYELYET